MTTWLELELPMAAYRTICADPPWTFGTPSATKVDPSRRYDLLSHAELEELPVASLTHPEGAHLYLWAVNGLLEDGFRLARAWGFRPITVITWCKHQPGVGYYHRGNTEHAIFATRGRPLVPDTAGMSTWYSWPKGPHSAKPAAFYDLVEAVSPGPYLEMFARTPRLGWDSWGDGFRPPTTEALEAAP